MQADPGGEGTERLRPDAGPGEMKSGSMEFGSMKIATFNINGVKARLPALLDWLAEARPDVVALQEIKCLDEAFPREEVEAAGYNVETHGQKGFNGVALLSRQPLEDVVRGLTNLGLTEALRSTTDAPGLYTFWDYQAGAWQRNNGIRIDHALLSPQAADLLRGCVIHKDVRGWDKPSDHVPLVVELEV